MGNKGGLKKRPKLLYFIIIIILLISISAILSGFQLIKDPSGKLLEFPQNFLENTFFHSYLIPGIILFLVIGILPLFLIYGIFRKNSLGFLEYFNFYKDKKWQFSFLIYYGFALIIWINVQTIFIPFFFLQPVISLIGVLIIFLSLFENIRNYYNK